MGTKGITKHPKIGPNHLGGAKYDQPKMSGKAKSLESYPGGMPGPGAYGSMNNKVVGKGMMKYMAGEPVGMAKYKSDAQRKAAHASMAEKGAGKYGKHMGPEKELVGKQKNLPEELKAKIEAAPGKYGHKKGPKKADFDKDMAEERIQIKDDKKKIFQDDKEKRESEGMKKYGHKKGPAKKKYIQDKEGKIEGKAKRIIGSGTKKILASRNKKEVGKKYKK